MLTAWVMTTTGPSGRLLAMSDISASHDALMAFIGAADKVAELLDDYTPRSEPDCEEAEALRRFQAARLCILRSADNAR